MKNAHSFMSDLYTQPCPTIDTRFVTNCIEKVNYVPDFNLRIWYNTQNENYALHQHNALEIIIPVENGYRVVVKGKNYDLNENDILIIPRYMLHELIAPAEGSRFIYLFNTEFLSVIHDIKILGPALLEPYIINENLHANIYGSIYNIFIKINSLYFSNAILLESSIYSLLLKGISIFSQEHFDQIEAATNGMTQQPGKRKEYYGKFNTMLLYIDAHYDENLTLEEMANQIGFSKFHFSRLFKQYTNTTFYEYLSHKRVLEAQALLPTNKSITDIAFQTGFNNLTTFSRCFKKYTECSPSEYRNRFIDPPANCTNL